MEHDDLMRVAVYESQTEANFVLSALKENGIDAKLRGDEVSAFGLALDGPDDIEVIVRKSDFEKAKAIVADIETAEEEPVPAWTCKCGEDVDEGFALYWSCGAEYEVE